LSSTQSQDYITKKIYINVGNEINSIEPYEMFNGILQFSGLTVDEHHNVYLFSFGDSSIKKFDENGDLVDRIKIQNTFFFDFYSYNGKIYALDKANHKNDLYIFDQKDLKNYEVIRHLYLRDPGEQSDKYWDRTLVINNLNHFHIFDLSTHKMYFNFKHPINFFKEKPEQEKEFFRINVKLGSNTFYVGKKDSNYVFFKNFYDLYEVYEIAVVNFSNNSRKVTRSLFHFDRADDTLGLVFDREIKLHKDGFIYTYGYEKNKLVINFINLDKIVNQVNDTNYGRKYIIEYFEKYSSKELKIKRNEIYARHGRTFKTKWLQEYFEGQPWYYKNSNYSNLLLKDNEKEIIEIIKSVENHKKR
jgi:hypothetical protein